MSEALKTLTARLKDADDILTVHGLVTGGTAGRPKIRLRALRRSVVVLAVGMWEAYVEDLLTECVEFMLGECTSVDGLPKELRKRLAAAVKSDKNELAVLELAGDGYQARVRKLVSDATGHFNTPKPENVDELLGWVLGLNLDWSRLTYEGIGDPRSRLEKLLLKRHEIAHTGETSRGTGMNDINMDRKFVEELAKRLDDVVAERLKEVCRGKQPW